VMVRFVFGNKIVQEVIKKEGRQKVVVKKEEVSRWRAEDHDFD